MDVGVTSRPIEVTLAMSYLLEVNFSFNLSETFTTLQIIELQYTRTLVPCKYVYKKRPDRSVRS